MILDPFLFAWCPECEEEVAIRDINAITVYDCLDMQEPIVAAICECGTSIKEFIDRTSVTRLVREGVTKRHFETLLEPLTKELIDSWDIDKELESFYARF